MSPDHDNVWKSFNIQYLRNQVWVSCSNQKTIGDCVCVLFDMVIGTWRLGKFTFNQPSMRIKSFRGQKVFVFWVETWCAQLIRPRIENNNKVFHRKQVVLKIFLPQQILWYCLQLISSPFSIDDSINLQYRRFYWILVRNSFLFSATRVFNGFSRFEMCSYSAQLWENVRQTLDETLQNIRNS